MTREEEICENSYTLDGIDNIQDWRYGARWADQHPRKGLWDTQKVIEWLKDNSKKYVVCYEDGYSHYAHNSLVEDLRKAMEE